VNVRIAFLLPNSNSNFEALSMLIFCWSIGGLASSWRLQIPRFVFIQSYAHYFQVTSPQPKTKTDFLCLFVYLFFFSVAKVSLIINWYVFPILYGVYIDYQLPLNVSIAWDSSMNCPIISRSCFLFCLAIWKSQSFIIGPYFAQLFEIFIRGIVIGGTVPKKKKKSRN
jgi:hypothetical protein